MKYHQGSDPHDKSESDSDNEEMKGGEERPPPANMLSKPGMALKKDNFPANNRVLDEKKQNANMIGMLVQDDVSFGDSSDGTYDSEEVDKLTELRAGAKIRLRKTTTTVPDNLKLDVAPSELLDDFFDDPLEHPLLPTNTFVKHKSEAIKPVGAFRSNLLAGLKKEPKDDFVKKNPL